MKTVIASILTDPSARTVSTAKQLAYSQNTFTPWEG